MKTKRVLLMKNSKIQFLFIFFISIFTSSVFGIDYFWLTRVELSDGSRLVGVEVAENSHKKLKQFFYKELTILDVEMRNPIVYKDIKKLNVVLSDRFYTYDEKSNTGEGDQASVYLTQLLAIKNKDNKADDGGIVAIPSKYKIEKITALNLKKAKITDRHKPYLDAIKNNSRGIIPEKTVKYMLANTDSLSIYEDIEKPSRFAIIRNFAFLDQKVVYTNFHGFSPFVNESSSPGFLLKINGKEYLLADFGFSVQREGWVEEVDMGYFLINLEEGKGYLPMHLRKEK
jgi:hypothetical protein|tara:strand:- start:20 stop:877 length:858 start_codon:yes stop_codon:yes gene_type:complete